MAQDSDDLGLGRGAAVTPLHRYAGQLGLDPAGLRLAAGQTSDVVISAELGQVWRFPRLERGVVHLRTAAARTDAARALGLPAPEVLALVPDLPPGQAYVAFRYLPGVGLSPDALSRLADPARRWLARDLAALVVRLGSGEVDRWPVDQVGQVGWVERWVALAARIGAEVLPWLPRDGRERAERALAAAVGAAHDAPAGLLHGDLGGTNLLIDPTSGRLTGVLDWEGAGPGDPAVDLAAIRSALDRDTRLPSLLGLLLDQAPALAAHLARAEAYLGTFALQEALHGAGTGTVQAWRAGTAAYR